MDFDRYTGNNWLVIEANIVAACQKCVHYVGLHVSSEMTHERHVLPLFDTFFRILYHIYMNLLVETCRPVNKQMCEDVGKYLFIWLVIGSRTYALKLPSGHSSGHVWISPFSTDVRLILSCVSIGHLTTDSFRWKWILKKVACHWHHWPTIT